MGTINWLIGDSHLFSERKMDEHVKIVTPAKAGVQFFCEFLDTGFRRYDVCGGFSNFYKQTYARKKVFMKKEGLQRRRTAKETAFQILKEKIMRQEFQAGDPLPEVALAKSLGVSRTPVREAILELQQAGLVEVIPNRGAFVTFITLKELKNIVQLLQILEGAAVDLALDAMDKAKLEAIETELLAFKKEGAEIRFEETTKPGIRLHDLILEATGNEKLFRIGKNIRDQIRSLSFNAVKQYPGRAAETVEEHLRILQALKAGDGAAAKNALAEHLANMYRALTQIIG